jgi:ribosome-binding factor A
MSVRVDKVAAQLRDEISAILARRVSDPRMGLVSIVGVDLSPDLRNARIHVSTIGDDAARGETMAALEHARGFIRRQVAAQMRSLRRIPEIKFVDDHNMEYAIHIGEVIEQLHDQESPEATSDEG